jgi:hypothetical protein
MISFHRTGEVPLPGFTGPLFRGALVEDCTAIFKDEGSNTSKTSGNDKTVHCFASV